MCIVQIQLLTQKSVELGSAGGVVGAMASGSVARPMIETGQIWLVWEPVDMSDSTG